MRVHRGFVMKRTERISAYWPGDDAGPRRNTIANTRRLPLNPLKEVPYVLHESSRRAPSRETHMMNCWKSYHAAVCAIVLADIDQYVDKAKVAALILSELHKMLPHLSFEGPNRRSFAVHC